jgi:hypothetical protein
VPAAVACCCACAKNGSKEPKPAIALACACCCNASCCATCGASPAKLSCLLVKPLAASCLAAKSAADSPGCCDIPANPVATTGTPDFHRQRF